MTSSIINGLPDLYYPEGLFAFYPVFLVVCGCTDVFPAVDFGTGVYDAGLSSGISIIMLDFKLFCFVTAPLTLF